MVGWLFARRDRAKRLEEAAARIAEERRGALMSAGLWTAFFAGAALAS